MVKNEDHSQIKIGVIKESYHFNMDGEYFSGYKEYNVVVTEYWKTGELKALPKEVKSTDTYNYKLFRHTKQKGWREYYKQTKKFKENRYTGTSVSFSPTITTNNLNEYNKVNLGHW